MDGPPRLWHDQQRRQRCTSVRSLGWSAPQAELVATGTETWSATFEDLPDNQRYQPVARVELSDGSAAARGWTAVHARQSHDYRERHVQRAYRGGPDRDAAAAVLGGLRGLRCGLQRPVLPVWPEPVCAPRRRCVGPMVRRSDPRPQLLTNGPAFGRRRDRALRRPLSSCRRRPTVGWGVAADQLISPATPTNP